MAKNKLCVALDADILRMLAEVDRRLNEDPNYDFSKNKDKVLRKQVDDVKLLLSYIKSGKLEVFVGNMVYHQVKHRPESFEFIKKYAYFPKMNMLTVDDLTYKSDELAFEYCNNREFGFPPMDMKYDPEKRRYKPSEDAYVMAEATIVNCLLITCNGKHFVFRENVKDDKNSRSTSIVRINQKYNYGTPDEYSNIVVPKPVLLRTLCEWIRERGFSFLSLPDVDTKTIEKASDLFDV